MSSSIFYLILFLAICKTSHQTSDLVTKTCDQTLYKDVCNSVLGSAPQTDVNDLHSLTKFALKSASLIGGDIHKKATELTDTSDSFLQQCLTDCGETYQDAIDQLEDSMAAVDNKAYNDVNTWVTAAMTDADSCEDGFKEKQGTTSPLTDLNKKFNNLCSIILTMSNLLAKN